MNLTSAFVVFSVCIRESYLMINTILNKQTVSISILSYTWCLLSVKERDGS